ncbi:flagellar filament capping protein FliD [Petroclostridium sp. X23]|uniref:flagellar filament capping protein FliD n=1 Tax=Petroclostridium sp. X23 TaxID=3045146 RepID=UPI0024AD44C6|nr:flagellar filament capping protein FliD [Petroclostridium sp. X23]WHH61509.1 flagellar filament capping protein FliD [Petroclostridium sp. X23]
MTISRINSMRLTGLATGLDTDSIIKNTLSIERMRIDVVSQKKQVAEWKRDQYREVTNLLRGIKSEYMDVLKPSTNMLSQSNYKKYTASTVDSATGQTSTLVSVSGTVNAMSGSHSVKVLQRASAAQAQSTENVTQELISTRDMNLSSAKLKGKSITLTLDGVTKEITFDADYSTTDDLITGGGDPAKKGLQKLINEAFGADKIEVLQVGTDDKIKFSTVSGATKLSIYSGSSETKDATSILRITPGTSNRINIYDSLENIVPKMKTAWKFDENDKLKFTINNKTFEFDRTTSLSNMMSTINGDETANVTMRYDETTDHFVIASKETGAAGAIIINEEDPGYNFVSAISVNNVIPNSGDVDGVTYGKDAKALIDEQEITRSTNSLSVNDLTYTLLRDPKDTEVDTIQNVTVDLDVDGIYENIQKFVEKYNEMITTINNRLSEKYDRNYVPLTDEQKEAMSEKEIENWEEQAKTGLLRNDAILEKIVMDMRRALFDPIEGVNINLTSIGITTGVYTEKGKLNIDETKLKNAIQNDSDAVMNLFSQKSSSEPAYYRTLSQEQREIRYDEEGLFQRLYDIIEDNISTFSDSGGRKGVLLEKAGIQADRSYTNNMIYNEILGYEKRMDLMWDNYYSKEDSLYKKYANLETAMNQLNNQTNSLLAQLGMGS